MGEATIFSLTDLIGILPVFMVVFYSLQLLILKNYKVVANRMLALMFFLFGIIQTVFMLSELELTKAAQLSLPLFLPAVLALAPTMYLYVKALYTDISQSTRKPRFLVHYSVQILVFVYAVVAYILLYTMPSDSKIVSSAISILQYLYIYGIYVAFTIQNIIYIILSVVLYFKHSKQVTDKYSYQEGISIKWVSFFILGYFLFVTGIILIEIIDWESNIPFYLVIVFYVAYIGIYGIKQMDTYYGLLKRRTYKPNNSAKETGQEGKEEKYSTSSLKGADKIQRLKEELVALMTEEKPFLNSRLSVYDIADSLNTNYRYVSQIINSEFNQNFMTFINTYRIEEAKKLLVSEEANQYTIEAIAEMAGFNSKSSFNTAFKKATHMTPSEYKNKPAVS